LLAFTSVYFSESGLFKGLRPIQIKKPLPSWVAGPMDPAGSGQLFRRISAPLLPFRVCFEGTGLRANIPTRRASSSAKSTGHPRRSALSWATSGVSLRSRSRALSGSGDKTLKLWDVDTGKEIRSFDGHTDWIRSVLPRRSQRAVGSCWRLRFPQTLGRDYGKRDPQSPRHSRNFSCVLPRGPNRTV